MRQADCLFCVSATYLESFRRLRAERLWLALDSAMEPGSALRRQFERRSLCNAYEVCDIASRAAYKKLWNSGGFRRLQYHVKFCASQVRYESNAVIIKL